MQQCICVWRKYSKLKRGVIVEDVHGITSIAMNLSFLNFHIAMQNSGKLTSRSNKQREKKG